MEAVEQPDEPSQGESEPPAVERGSAVGAYDSPPDEPGSVPAKRQAVAQQRTQSQGPISAYPQHNERANRPTGRQAGQR